MQFLQIALIFSVGLLLPAVAVEVLTRGDFQLQLIGSAKFLKDEKVTLRNGIDVAIYCFTTHIFPQWTIPLKSHALQGPIVKRENGIMLTGSFLIFHSTNSEDSGTYECSGEGRTTFRMTLEVTKTEFIPKQAEINKTIDDYNATQKSLETNLETVTISLETTEASVFWTNTEDNETYISDEDENWQKELSTTEEHSDNHTWDYEENFKNEIFGYEEDSNLNESRSKPHQKSKENVLIKHEETTLISIETTTSIPILSKETEDTESFKVIMVELPKFLKGDVVEMEVGETKTIACFYYVAYPRWITPNGSHARRHYTPLNVGFEVVYASYVNITKARPEDAGKYECVGENSSAVITVKITGVTCPELKVVEHVKMSLSNGVKEGSWASFTCQSRRKLLGTARIKCQKNGKWSDSVPTCRFRYACDDLPPLEGGLVTYSTRYGPSKISSVTKLFTHVKELKPSSLSTNLHKLGTRAIHECNSSNYELAGSKVRKCVKGGKWRGRPASCSPICGIRNSSQFENITSGNAEDGEQWPWQVAIFRHFPLEGWLPYCGGSLVNDRWVITAAHCLTEKLEVDNVLDAQYFQLHVGQFHRKNKEEDIFRQTRKIRDIYIHPDYMPQYLDADIALLEMDSSVSLNSHVQPICLPTKKTAEINLVQGREGVFTGWGINETGDAPEVLQQKRITILTNDICLRSFTEAGLTVPMTDNVFCAGDGHSDVCKGYSGGPMAFEVDYANQKRWVLEGIVSFGSPQGCRIADQYSGFTKVSSYLDWIKEIM